MKYIEILNDYSKKKEFKYALFSDMHIDAKHCQRELLKKNLDYCYENYDGIFLNGDTFSCLLPKDLKRFTLAHAFCEEDNILDKIIDYVTDLLAPYADKILFIGMGNHESSVLKFHGTNPADRLRRQLKEHDGKAVFGDYQNVIRFKFHHGENSRIRTYDMWTCHGRGSGAKRSRGSLEWDIDYAYYGARLYWKGHNHMGEIDQTGSYTYVNRAGEFVTEPKKGIRTPAWEEPVSIRDTNAPYDIKYGEERHGIPTALPAFGLLELNPIGDTVKDQISLKCI